MDFPSHVTFEEVKLWSCLELGCKVKNIYRYVFLTKHKCSQIFHITLNSVPRPGQSKPLQCFCSASVGRYLRATQPVPVPKWPLPPTPPRRKHPELPRQRAPKLPRHLLPQHETAPVETIPPGPLYVKLWSSPCRADHPKAKPRLVSPPPPQRLPQPRSCLPLHGAGSSAPRWGCGTCWLPLPFLFPI